MTKRTAFILYLLISQEGCVSRMLYPTPNSFNVTPVPMQNRSDDYFENFSLASTTMYNLNQLPAKYFYSDLDVDTIKTIANVVYIIKICIVLVGLLGNVLIVVTLVERKLPTHNLMLITLAGMYIIIMTKVYLVHLKNSAS